MSGAKRYMHISPLCAAAPVLMANYPMATEYVLASDYDRDTQALRERADAEQEAHDGQRRILDAVKAERDELRAQVEAMRTENESARRTGAFWKDEKICADTVIDQLRVQVEAMRGALERAREVVAFHHVTAGDRFREIELAAIDAAMQAKP